MVRYCRAVADEAESSASVTDAKAFAKACISTLMHRYVADALASLEREVADAKETEEALIGSNDANFARYVESAAEADRLRREVADRDERIAMLTEALTKIDAVRNDIIARQSINWSAHIYPLVAALEAAGFKGVGYEKGRAALLAPSATEGK